MDLVEHAGWAKTGIMGWEVENFLSQDTIEITKEDIKNLREAQTRANNEVEHVLDTADRPDRDDA